jgi:hypothetical protein
MSGRVGVAPTTRHHHYHYHHHNHQKRRIILLSTIMVMTTRLLYSVSLVNNNRVSAFYTVSTKIIVSRSESTSTIKSRPFTSLLTRPSKPTSTVLRQSTRRQQDDLAAAAEFSSFAGDGGYNRPTVQWYPGHIAKAERQLSETLKAVDVVVEVRDARACKATAHPKVGEWCAGRPRIVVLTHLDTVPRAAASSWRKAYETLGAERWDDAPINRQVANQAQQARDIRSQFLVVDDPNIKDNNKKQQQQQQQRRKNSSTTAKSIVSTANNKQVSNAVTPVEQVLFVNAKQGQGIHALHRAIFKAGAHVQERRERRGLNPRALRVGIIGYPNVGKSVSVPPQKTKNVKRKTKNHLLFL